MEEQFGYYDCYRDGEAVEGLHASQCCEVVRFVNPVPSLHVDDGVDETLGPRFGEVEGEAVIFEVVESECETKKHVVKCSLAGWYRILRTDKLLAVRVNMTCLTRHLFGMITYTAEEIV